VDIGKQAPAGNSETDGYRRTGAASGEYSLANYRNSMEIKFVQTISGPQSSVSEYTPTVDIGKQAPAGNSETDGYRRLGAAAGEYNAQIFIKNINSPQKI
jgi:hypothetical protein